MEPISVLPMPPRTLLPSGQEPQGPAYDAVPQPSARARLVRQQACVDAELERFRHEARPETDELPCDIGEILDCIHDNLFDSQLNVNTAKTRCRIRNNNVSTRFRQIVGLGIREYIESCRIQAACRLLLRRREVRIFLVAISIGYEHPETFCRAFKRAVGCTPSRYRAGA